LEGIEGGGLKLAERLVGRDMVWWSGVKDVGDLMAVVLDDDKGFRGNSSRVV
jgi:hypothetical protein